MKTDQIKVVQDHFLLFMKNQVGQQVQNCLNAKKVYFKMPLTKKSSTTAVRMVRRYEKATLLRHLENTKVK